MNLKPLPDSILRLSEIECSVCSSSGLMNLFALLVKHIEYKQD